MLDADWVAVFTVPLELLLVGVTSLSLYRLLREEKLYNDHVVTAAAEAPTKLGPLKKCFSCLLGLSMKQQFHIVLILAMVARVLFLLGNIGYVRGQFSLALMSALRDLAATFYVLSYVMLLFFWLEVYLSLRDSMIHHPVSPFSSVAEPGNLGDSLAKLQWARRLMYVFVVLALIADIVVLSTLRHRDEIENGGEEKHVHLANTIVAGIISLIGLLVASAFVFVGILLGKTLRGRTGIVSRRHVARVVAVCTIVTCCFCARATLGIISVHSLLKYCFLRDPSEEEKQEHCQGRAYSMSFGWLVLLYVVFEVVPYALMLFVLRRTPRSRSTRGIGAPLLPSA